MSIRDVPAFGEDYDPSPRPRPAVELEEFRLPRRMRRRDESPPPPTGVRPAEASPSPLPTPPEALPWEQLPVETVAVEIPPVPPLAVDALPVEAPAIGELVEEDPADAPEAPPSGEARSVASLPAGPDVEQIQPGPVDSAIQPVSPRPDPPPATIPRPIAEVRRVRRVVRQIDTWSLFRFAVILYGCMLVVCMAAFVGVWLVASGAGAIPSIENFVTQLFALKKFHFKAFQLFGATFAIGIIGVFVATLITVVAGVLYNLITDVVGGVEVTVLEEGYPADG